MRIFQKMVFFHFPLTRVIFSLVRLSNETLYAFSQINYFNYVKAVSGVCA